MKCQTLLKLTHNCKTHDPYTMKAFKQAIFELNFTHQMIYLLLKPIVTSEFVRAASP